MSICVHTYLYMQGISLLTQKFPQIKTKIFLSELLHSGVIIIADNLQHTCITLIIII